MQVTASGEGSSNVNILPWALAGLAHAGSMLTDAALVKHGCATVQEKATGLECEVAALQVSLAAEQGRAAQFTGMLEKACAKAHMIEGAHQKAER